MVKYAYLSKPSEIFRQLFYKFVFVIWFVSLLFCFWYLFCAETNPSDITVKLCGIVGSYQK